MNDSFNPDMALTRADFDAMAAMEAHFYGEDLITPAEESWNWYERYPFTIVAARGEQTEIAGFVNLFPVSESVYVALLAGAFNDANLTTDDVVDPWAQGADSAPLHMFLSCVVVDTPWQGSGLAYRLVARAAEQYAQFAARIADIAIDTATPDGAGLVLEEVEAGLLLALSTNIGELHRAYQVLGEGCNLLFRALNVRLPLKPLSPCLLGR